MILTYDDLRNQKQLDEVIAKYTKFFPDHAEITPAMVRVAVENWIPLYAFLEDKLSPIALAEFRLEQERIIKENADALYYAMKFRKPDMSVPHKKCMASMEQAYRNLMEYDSKQEDD